MAEFSKRDEVARKSTMARPPARSRARSPLRPRPTERSRATENAQQHLVKNDKTSGEAVHELAALKKEET